MGRNPVRKRLGATELRNGGEGCSLLPQLVALSQPPNFALDAAQCVARSC
jgi:hypothetical protein